MLTLWHRKGWGVDPRQQIAVQCVCQVGECPTGTTLRIAAPPPRLKAVVEVTHDRISRMLINGQQSLPWLY